MASRKSVKRWEGPHLRARFCRRMETVDLIDPQASMKPVHSRECWEGDGNHPESWGPNFIEVRGEELCGRILKALGYERHQIKVFASLMTYRLLRDMPRCWEAPVAQIHHMVGKIRAELWAEQEAKEAHDANLTEGKP